MYAPIARGPLILPANPPVPRRPDSQVSHEFTRYVLHPAPARLGHGVRIGNDANWQGLLEGRWCLDPAEELSPGQLEEIDRVCSEYPELTDDAFVRNFIHAQKMHPV